MAEEQVTERKNTKGFGTTMLNHLTTVEHASTVELAKYVGVTVEQAYTRLMYLQSKEKKVTSSGKGEAKIWSLSQQDGEPVVQPKKVKEIVTNVFGKSHGWKPCLTSFLAPVAPIMKGDTLLVEYPEHWRHSAIVTVLRTPDDQGVAQCWDRRNKCYAYVPVTPVAVAKHDVRLVVVTGEKNFQILENG